MGVNPLNNGHHLNLGGFAMDRFVQIHPDQHSSSHTVLYSSSANPRLLLLPSSSYKLPHPCGRHARAIRFSFSLAPLISLCSRMWAERDASPTLKITTSVWQSVCVCVWKGCVSVRMSRGGGVGEYSQLTGSRLNCSYSRKGGMMAMKGAIYFLQTLLARKCQVPATINVESQSLFRTFNPCLVQNS